MTQIAKHIIFTGRVQGVGFRFTVYDMANRYQLIGQVRNLGDGTVEMIAQGDASAGGTLGRLTTRHDRIMEYYYKNSKLLGTGISTKGLEAFDQHVGNQSMLATGGLLEVFIFVGFLFYIVSKTILINKTLHPSNNFKHTILYFIFFLIGFLVIHSTSSFKFGIVGWIKFSGSFIMVILFFTIYNNILIEAKNRNYQIETKLTKAAKCPII